MTIIALFGATGKTGTHILSQALQKGYQVRALVRDTAKLTVVHPHLTVVQGDALVAADVEKTIQGSDVIISALGHVKNSPAWIQTDATKNMVAAMKKYGVKKIISLSGAGVPFEKDKPKFIDNLVRTIMQLTVPSILNDGIEHAKVLQNSGLDWIVVRGPMLKDGAKKGGYKVTFVDKKSGISINRADLAEFMLAQIDDNTYLKQMPVVSY